MGNDALFAFGAKEIPPDVCFSVIRLVPILMADLKIEGRAVSYEATHLKHHSLVIDPNSKKSKSQVVATCRTENLKQPYDKMTAELKAKIINTFKKPRL